MFTPSTYLIWIANIAALVTLVRLGWHCRAFRNYAAFSALHSITLLILALCGIWSQYFYIFHVGLGAQVLLLLLVLKEIAETTIFPSEILPAPVYRAASISLTFVIGCLSGLGVVFHSLSPVRRYAVARSLEAWAFCVLLGASIAVGLITRYLAIPWRAHPRWLYVGLNFYLIMEVVYRVRIKNLHIPALDAVHLCAFLGAAGIWITGLSFEEERVPLPSLSQLQEASETLRQIVIRRVA